jgi:hypothetical protein
MDATTRQATSFATVGHITSAAPTEFYYVIGAGQRLVIDRKPSSSCVSGVPSQRAALSVSPQFDPATSASNATRSLGVILDHEHVPVLKSELVLEAESTSVKPVGISDTTLTEGLNEFASKTQVSSTMARIWYRKVGRDRTFSKGVVHVRNRRSS